MSKYKMSSHVSSFCPWSPRWHISNYNPIKIHTSRCPTMSNACWEDSSSWQLTFTERTKWWTSHTASWLRRHLGKIGEYLRFGLKKTATEKDSVSRAKGKWPVSSGLWNNNDIQCTARKFIHLHIHHTVDGRNPAPPEMYKTINYQPQLVSRISSIHCRSGSSGFFPRCLVFQAPFHPTRCSRPRFISIMC